MPEKTFVEDLEAHAYVQSVFLVTEKQRRRTKNDDPYLALTLADRTGDIPGRVWENVDMLDERFDTDDFVAVEGEVSTYNDDLQLTVRDLQQIPESDVDTRQFLRHSEWPTDDLFDQLCDAIDREIDRPPVRRFLSTLLGDDERRRRFQRAPAAKSNHHDYVGGLLEHTLSMVRIASDLADHYADYYPDLLDRSLLVAGCILHDIGKIDELACERSISYTTEGQLVGHVAGGAELVGRVASQTEPPVPDELEQQLKHLVLSHHGHHEYGAPVEPKTPEATLLHEIDMIDSRMNVLHQALEEHRAGPQSDADWTNYHRSFEGSIFAGRPDGPDGAGVDPSDVSGPGGSRPADSSDESAQSGETGGASDVADGDADETDSRTVDMFGEK